jgi:hypothetical protein
MDRGVYVGSNVETQVEEYQNVENLFTGSVKLR